MRISDTFKNNHFFNSIRKNQADTAIFQQQLASGKRVTKASDNPAAFTRSRTVNSFINANEQYLSNINRASNLVGTSLDALERITDRVISLKSLLVNASNDTLNSDSREKMGTQARMLKEQIFDTLNTKWQGIHVFGGSNGSKPAFTFDETTESFVSESTSDVLRIPISDRNTAAATIQADSVRNVGGQDIFNIIDQAIDALESNDSETLRNLLADVDDIVDGLVTLSTTRAEELNKLIFASDHLRETNVLLKAELSELIDTDVLEAYSQLQRYQVAYETMLAVHSTDSRTSLLQYI